MRVKRMLNLKYQKISFAFYRNCIFLDIYTELFFPDQGHLYCRVHVLVQNTGSFISHLPAASSLAFVNKRNKHSSKNTMPPPPCSQLRATFPDQPFRNFRSSNFMLLGNAAMSKFQDIGIGTIFGGHISHLEPALKIDFTFEKKQLR